MDENLPTKIYSRGSNPLLQTKRGKVQQRRGILNEQISKQIRLKTGAENLLRVTQDKKIRDQIALELSFLDSNLQLLREELTELNADVQIYQNEKCLTHLIIPQLALGLKETKDLDFTISFNDIIRHHYGDDPKRYETPIRTFAALRKVVRSPPRNENGVRLLIEYYNHLCLVEKRFYSSRTPLNTYFEWYDAVTGIPSIQKSIAFEKGSILFNIASLFTQLGANEDRNQQIGLQKCLDYYGRAVGCFDYLKNNFSHAPSNDMKPETLIALNLLFLSQIQECIWQICFDQLSNVEGFHQLFVLAQESSEVSKMYAQTCHALLAIPFKPYLPTAWFAFANLKQHFFASMSHYFTASGVLYIKSDTDDDIIKRFKSHFVIQNGNETLNDVLNDHDETQRHSEPLHWIFVNPDQPPSTPGEKRLFAQIHLRQASSLLEECISILKLNKSLRKLSGLLDYLRKFENNVAEKRKLYHSGELDVDLYDAHEIFPRTTYPAVMIHPDFKRYDVQDFFRDLGPPNVFNIKDHLTPPRTVELARSPLCPGFGFSVKGDTPVAVSSVEPGGLAYMNEINAGDYIIAVGDIDCKWALHDEVVQLIRQCGDKVSLTVVSKIPSYPCSLIESPPLQQRSFNNHSGPSTVNCSSNNSLRSTSRNSEHDVKKNVVSSQKTSSSSTVGWLSSALPVKFRSKKKNQNAESFASISSGTSSPAIPLTFDSLKSLKDNKTSRSPSLSSSSWKIRGFLSLKKSLSERQSSSTNVVSCQF